MLGVNSDITLWNRFVAENGEIRYFHHILEGKGRFARIAGNSLKNGGFGNCDSFKAVIAFSERYMPKAAWDKACEDIKHEFFTVGKGDLIAKGKWYFSLNEDLSAAEIKALLAPEIFTVTKYKDNMDKPYGKHIKLEGA